MYFYRHPGWGFGMRILMVVLLIAGIGIVSKTAFMAGFARSAVVEGGEAAVPYLAPHAKGYGYNPLSVSFLTVIAVFLGGILLIKLVSAIVGLVMFNRWKKAAGEDWVKMGPWSPRKTHRMGGNWAHCGPWHPGPWDTYPIKGEPETPEAPSPDSES